VFSLDDALAAADGGAHEIVFDPFLRHPAPPLARVARVRDALAARGVAFRLRTPTIARPDDRPRLDRWLALGLPLQTAHVGIAGHAERYGNVIADYGTNVFNPHTAALLFARGVSRIVASVELTSREIAALVAPWGGAGFDVVLYGRPEGMTIEHCVLSAAFDREPTTCRDLCVQKYPDVRLTDPAHYTFAVATDSDCRNRLLHSRPIDGSEHLCAVHRAGLRGFQLLFNVPGDPVEAIVRAYRAQLDAVDAGEVPDIGPIRALLGREFTRGHFQRAV
jgi:putative protease